MEQFVSFSVLDANYCIMLSQLKALGIDNILGFDWPASPTPEAMIRALEVLYSLGVLDNDAKLTSPVGFQVAEIPLVCCLLTSEQNLSIFLLPIFIIYIVAVYLLGVIVIFLGDCKACSAVYYV